MPSRGDRLRTICLALPDAVEKATWEHATYRIGERIFAIETEAAGRGAVSVKAPPGSQQMLVEAAPDRFFVPAYVGHKGWVGMWLDRGPDWQEVATLVARSYSLIAPRRRK